MIEDEAKTKNCPLYSAASIFAVATIAAPEAAIAMEAGRKCEGSACMMWRWSTAANGPDDDGYCGLAPQSQTAVPRETIERFGKTVILDGEETQSTTAATASPENRRIGKGVYSNPQPGDADYPGGG